MTRGRARPGAAPTVEVRSRRRGFRADSPRIARFAEALLASEAYPAGRVSLVFTGDRVMAQLCRDWLGKTGTTDVLAFDLRDDEGGGGAVAGSAASHDAVLGEVIVSVDRARAQARAFGVPLSEEIARLVIHGLLHLAGHDHHAPGERRSMQARERRWMAAAGRGRGWVRAAPRG